MTNAWLLVLVACSRATHVDPPQPGGLRLQIGDEYRAPARLEIPPTAKIVVLDIPGADQLARGLRDAVHDRSGRHDARIECSLARPECVARLGEALGADYLVGGTVTGDTARVAVVDVRRQFVAAGWSGPPTADGARVWGQLTGTAVGQIFVDGHRYDGFVLVDDQFGSLHEATGFRVAPGRHLVTVQVGNQTAHSIVDVAPGRAVRLRLERR